MCQGTRKVNFLKLHIVVVNMKEKNGWSRSDWIVKISSSRPSDSFGICEAENLLIYVYWHFMLVRFFFSLEKETFWKEFKQAQNKKTSFWLLFMMFWPWLESPSQLLMFAYFFFSSAAPSSVIKSIIFRTRLCRERVCRCCWCASAPMKERKKKLQQD